MRTTARRTPPVNIQSLALIVTLSSPPENRMSFRRTRFPASKPL